MSFFTNVLALAIALLVFVAPIVAIVSFGVRGYNLAKSQQDLNPMPFVFAYAVVGFLVSAFIVSIFLTVATFIVGANLRYDVCKFFTGDSSSQLCSKYK